MSEQEKPPLNERNFFQALNRASGCEALTNVLDNLDYTDLPAFVKKITAGFAAAYSFFLPTSYRYREPSKNIPQLRFPNNIVYGMIVDWSGVILSNVTTELLLLTQYSAGMINADAPIQLTGLIMATDFIASKVGVNALTHYLMDKVESNSNSKKIQ